MRHANGGPRTNGWARTDDWHLSELLHSGAVDRLANWVRHWWRADDGHYPLPVANGHGPPEERLSADEIKRVAETHLGDLAQRQHQDAPPAQQIRMVRLRRGARRLRSLRVRTEIGIERMFRATRTPQRAVGRVLMRYALLHKQKPLFVLAALAGVAVLGYLTMLVTDSAVVNAVAGACFTAAFLWLIASVWKDFIRNPWLARSLRRRVAQQPDRILPSTPGRATRETVSHDAALSTIERPDLYEELVPGLRSKGRRDVHVVVGEPGSGKTTALVSIAGILARVGILPILVPLRNKSAVSIVDEARDTFNRQVDAHMRSDAERDSLWRWLLQRKRVAVLTDDIDQIGPDGEKGFVLRRTLEELSKQDLPVVVTARPAGIPAGIAASAIELGDLGEDEVVRHLLDSAAAAPVSAARSTPSERELRYWVKQGHLTEVPFYLELLAQLAREGDCPELPSSGWAADALSGRCRHATDGTCEWNPLWARFMLLEHFRSGAARGRVRSWLAIADHEREKSLEALEGAALGMLLATGLSARAAREGDEHLPKRSRLEEFIEPDDRGELGRSLRRSRVSQHEVVDTGERLRVLERDADGSVEFRHRIMQAYMASRRLVAGSEGPGRARVLEWVDLLVDRHHPEKLTAHMTLTFAAMGVSASRGESGRGLGNEIIDRLVGQAEARLPRGSVQPRSAEIVDPREVLEPEERADPDDALIKLTTAADVARAIGCDEGDWEMECQRWEKLKARPPDAPHPRSLAGDGVSQARIVVLAQNAHGATRWTKLSAIRAIAALSTEHRWKCVWEFARDDDYSVRRGACRELEACADEAYGALHENIDTLIVRAAARDALGRGIVTPTVGSDPATNAGVGQRAPGTGAANTYDIDHWDEKNDILLLGALGWVLPAIVSGLRQTPGGSDAVHVRRARRALKHLVTLAFAGAHHDLEASVAQGFKSDAMRHATGATGKASGPGQVASNRRLVSEICLQRAEFWYARTVLHQALALYAIAAGKQEEARVTYSRLLRSGRERHPFARRSARLARKAVERRQAGSDTWSELIWGDEGQVVGRRPATLHDTAARLVGDLTVLLNLNESRGDDLKAQFGHMRELPVCLSTSPDRSEILGDGCPEHCGWGLCPYGQPPPDEPNAHRGVSRAFCRHQGQIARKPQWQRTMGKRQLQQFWRDMEQRART